MKIFLAQQNYHIGNFEDNVAKIVAAIQEAAVDGADLVVFSELCVCGYPPRDFLEFEDFINKCYKAIDTIKSYTKDVAVIVGAPCRNDIKEGKDLFNAAWFLHEGEVKQVIHKTLLPTYDVFDEYRYFEPAYSWAVIPFKDKRLAVTICEDIWNLGDNPLYRIAPMDRLIDQAPDLMINISASPFDYNARETRQAIVRENVLKYKIPMFYCNTVGSQTEIVFDGGSVVYDANGELVKELPYFKEALVGFDLEKIPALKESPAAHPVVQPYHQLEFDRNIDRVHGAIVMGIRDYFQKMGFKKAILGSSGGIDSAVTLALACEALGKENVRAILMPSPYSTDHSVDDAVRLSKNLDNPHDIIRINNIYEGFLQTLEPYFNGLPFNVAEENMQSRIRGNLLMGLANKFGYILLNTSNKSELSTGYGTLYGDMAGGLSVLGDVYKMQVYALAEFINRDEEIIPGNIITKAPSAELRPGQKDSDSLPDYTILDQVLFQYIERRKGPREIIEMGFDPQLVARTLKLVNTNEYKRNQFCPIIRVSSKAFGVGRRVPIVGKYLS
ncbi:NAD+ synthase [Chitinophaga caeni]|uniref:Glutamine-dependent NAD(+) synthetase n=1 Tax=Chitinophaga caeni TaxID=2029983 RepID=A0A291QSX1_9BACT|nr:NAD+ synthase [Chitinophaga caeni]ATL47045.1 NAD+ synthase [Chitinophaga caeni]